MKLNKYPDFLGRSDQFELYDDFLWYVSPHLWTSLAADTNTAVAIDADGESGVLSIGTGDATDNNEAGTFTTNELFKFAADRPLCAEARIQFTEINTSAANVAFGFADAGGADLLGDDGAGDAIANSGALIFKVDGETVWRAACENNGTVRETQSTTTAGGSSYQTLRIESRDMGDGNQEITYFVDGQPLRDSNGKQIKHTLAHASATQMDLGVYAKAGAANTLTVLVDYIAAFQKR